MFNSFEEVQAFCKDQEIRFLDFKMVDLTGRYKHLTIPVSQLTPSLFEEGFGFDGSNYGYAVLERSDMAFIPDLQSAFLDPFYQERTLSFLGNVYLLDEQQSRFSQDPRAIIQKAEKHLKETGIADSFVIGPEFEFYVFDRTEYASRPNLMGIEIDSVEGFWNSWTGGDGHQGYLNRQLGGYHAAPPLDRNADLRNEMVQILEEMDIPVKYHHHEVGGPGQLEIEVELGPASRLADHTLLIKHVVKNTAMAWGKTATFMPKPLFDEAGSGMHIHMHLFKDDEPVFYDSSGLARLSDTALHFMGGILKHAPSLTALTNPSTNSYRRLVPGYEAPVSICFGIANRSSVIRIPAYARTPRKVRYEIRSPDATCNPYFAYAAVLMAGIDGMKQKIDPQKEGWGPFDTNVYNLSPQEQAKIGALPASLEEALLCLEKDHEYLLQGNVFPKELIETWISTKAREAREVSLRPHPQEFSLYYDL